MQCLLGIDIGTYASKGVLVDHEGRILADASVAHEPSFPRPGWVEADADAVWWGDFVQLARGLPEQASVAPGDIVAVACSAIGPCVLPVDRQGCPLRPAILYGIDTRASKEVQELTDRLGEEWILSNTGSRLSSQAAGPKVLWLRRHEPEIWAHTKRIMGATSYLVYRLTGRAVIDHYTAAAYGPLYNLHRADWDPSGLAEICDRSKLPELEWSTIEAGAVTREAALETGIPAGTLVTVGTADAAAEAVAAGVLDPGDTMLMYGTTLFFIQICSRLVNSREQWPTVYLEPGSYALAAGMSTAGALTRWFRDKLAPLELALEQQGGQNVYRRLAEEAALVPRGAEGLLALPYFSGERTPINDPFARGVVAGLTLSHTRAHLYRALLEGIGYAVRHNLESMSKAGAAPRRLVAIGGGVRNELWTQIVSDVTGREQTVQSTPGASYGDAMMAAVAAGLVENLGQTRRWVPEGKIIHPDSSAFAFYDRTYALFRELYEHTKGVVHALAE